MENLSRLSAAGHSISYMDDRLLERLGTDIRYCWPGLLPNSPVMRGEDDDTFYDSYGQVWKRAVPYYYAGEGILKNASSVDDIESPRPLAGSLRPALDPGCGGTRPDLIARTNRLLPGDAHGRFAWTIPDRL